MGFLDRFGGRSARETRVKVDTLLLEDGSDRVAVVGESNYQGAIRSACGAAPGQAVRFDCVAVLVAEPDNSFDPNAVMVHVADGGKVGYLSREDAVAYQPAVRAAASSGYVIACPAHIAGRGREGQTTNLGVFLKLPSPEEAVTEIQAF